MWGPPPTQVPHRYVAVTTLQRDGETLDDHETRFGIRALEFDPNRGVLVNGERIYVQGVNQHHDLGALGAALLVGLNSDASARKLGKGADRPLNPLADRMAVLAALECVDAVTWFDEDTPERLIAACRPQVLVKGGDWPVERIAGAGGVLARGGQVVSIPFEHQRSTTALVERIRKA